ncbi:DivIVA domain-containing protein [Nesterenkonia sp. NBAIMH1]|uniref:DivIVA domain-containing protein n=1 Tax=Nesterenkonia sp. NBAIMH1 TaxID=2600320 RepID=UPI0011B62E27|nr:DivIVA domain-containing protein [Nesterenkonia sp. NBAIMH1]
MALTPEDLLNKEFPETKFRPGYDKDEVDDFLDEIVVEWRRLIQENEDLAARNESLQEQLDNDPRHVEPDSLSDAGLSGYAGTDSEMTGTLPAQDESGPRADPSVTAYPDYELGTRPAQERPAPATPVEDQANSAAGVLAMAQKLHDQYVSEGEETRAAYIAEGEQTRDAYIAEGESKRAELISDGESTKEQLVSEGTSKRDELVNEGETRRTEILTDAETRAENMIEEAELTSTRTLNALERKKSDLESRVSELTGFERDYRARLKDYIESQLNDLNSKGSIEKEASS